MKTKKLVCVITGKKLFATSEYYDKKLARHNGNEELMLSHYMCKEAKRLIQQGYTVQTTREMLGVDLDNVQEVSDDVVTAVLNENRKIPRVRTGESVNSLNMTNHQTDPDVKDFLNRITKKYK